MRLLSILLLAAISWTAYGQALPELPPPDVSVMQSDGLTLSEAVERVRRQYNGRIVEAETRCNGKREVHVIKVLTGDGKVKTVTVPGKRCG